MLGGLWLWLATRAASAWIALAGFALLTAAYVAYDHRGDRIAALELELIQCKGTAKQAKAIKQLSERIQEQFQDQADNDVSELKALPNDCYPLDGPSPLDGLLKSANKKPSD